jgi:hypothetical protein
MYSKTGGETLHHDSAQVEKSAMRGLIVGVMEVRSSDMICNRVNVYSHGFIGFSLCDSARLCDM